jgi:hypothetical protein
MALMAAGTAVLPAQFGRLGSNQTMRATITGSRGGEGKCTIEVEVDGSAEVDISGDSGRIRTIAGQPSNFRRMECTEPMPRNPANFRFEGVDGRGNVNLIRDPRQSRGVAVVRIDDPKGGREGYTFDLKWSGSEGGSYEGSPAWDRNNDRLTDRNRNRNRNGDFNRGSSYRVTCEADGNRRNFCEADTSGGVRIVRGNGACREGSTWGYTRTGIWVDQGCRAQFEVGR